MDKLQRLRRCIWSQRSLLVVGYAACADQRVFAELAKRMEEIPSLDTRLILNIARKDGDTTPSEILVTRFAQAFKGRQWSAGCRLPEVYYDPRSVAEHEPIRSSLHAKCIVVDEQQVLVSSANFPEAAQERNVEGGLKIESEWLASRLIRHFTLLRESRLAVRPF